MLVLKKPGKTRESFSPPSNKLGVGEIIVDKGTCSSEFYWYIQSNGKAQNFVRSQEGNLANTNELKTETDFTAVRIKNHYFLFE